jgi:hypothetical protein
MEDSYSKLQKFISTLSQDIAPKWFMLLGWILLASFGLTLTLFAKETFSIIIAWTIVIVSGIFISTYISFVLLKVFDRALTRIKPTILKVVLIGIIFIIVSFLSGLVAARIMSLISEFSIFGDTIH